MFGALRQDPRTHVLVHIRKRLRLLARQCKQRTSHLSSFYSDTQRLISVASSKEKTEPQMYNTSPQRTCVLIVNPRSRCHHRRRRNFRPPQLRAEALEANQQHPVAHVTDSRKLRTDGRRNLQVGYRRPHCFQCQKFPRFEVPSPDDWILLVRI